MYFDSLMVNIFLNKESAIESIYLISHDNFVDNLNFLSFSPLNIKNWIFKIDQLTILFNFRSKDYKKKKNRSIEELFLFLYRIFIYLQKSSLMFSFCLSDILWNKALLFGNNQLSRTASYQVVEELS